MGERFREMNVRIRSQLASWQPKPMDTAAIKADGWCNLGILVVDIQDKGLSNEERATIEAIGQRLYGRRVANVR
jgi:hypothetical protein